MLASVWGTRMRAVVLIVAALALVVAAPAAAQSPAYRFVHGDYPTQDRDAYLLTLIAAEPAAAKAVANDPDLEAIAGRLGETRAAVLAACRQTKACPVERLMLSDAEIGRAGDALAAMAAAGKPLSGVARQMRASGLFQRHAGLSDVAMVRAAWSDTAQGINRLYRVYALGEKPRYPEIDSMTRDPASDEWRHLLLEALQVQDDIPPTLFHQPWSRMGLDLLLLNQRDEAVRYEPIEGGENAAAFAKARGLDWKAAKYTAIVVPGAGLDGIETGLSSVGALRVRLAARRWRDGQAPFILVSGGHVHPNRTPFAEAVEMKTELVKRYGVPASAIIIDPYARHTTTNLRNATRLLFRMGAPMDKAMLITTSVDQSRYIEVPAFAQRCAQELGYQPVTVTGRLSPYDLTAKPQIASLYADATDPLDP